MSLSIWSLLFTVKLFILTVENYNFQNCLPRGNLMSIFFFYVSHKWSLPNEEIQLKSWKLFNRQRQKNCGTCHSHFYCLIFFLSINSIRLFSCPFYHNRNTKMLENFWLQIIAHLGRTRPGHKNNYQETPFSSRNIQSWHPPIS